MKVVFFSDVHGNQYTVEKMLGQLEKERPDALVFGGDVFGYYYGQSRIISLLRSVDCVCLRGNHDQYFLDLLDGKRDEIDLIERYGLTYKDISKRIKDEDIDFIRTFKTRQDLESNGIRMTFVHGSIYNPLEGRIYPDTQIEDIEQYMGIDYVFAGHTHHRMVRELGNGTTILNPGSLGQQRDGRGCAYGVFDTELKEWIVKEVKYNKELLVSEILSHNEYPKMENKLIEVLYREYK